MYTPKRICLWALSVLCVLALSACAVPATPTDSTDAIGQSTAPLSLSYRTAVYSVGSQDVPVNSKIEVLSYETCQNYIQQSLQNHGDCNKDVCSFSGGQTDEDCDSKKALKSISYPKEFFDGKNLLLIQLPVGFGTPFEITELCYEREVLTCTLQLFVPPDGGASNSATAFWWIFVETDTALSVNTNVLLNPVTIRLEQDEYAQKVQSFQEKQP